MYIAKASSLGHSESRTGLASGHGHTPERDRPRGFSRTCIKRWISRDARATRTAYANRAPYLVSAQHPARRGPAVRLSRPPTWGTADFSAATENRRDIVASPVLGDRADLPDRRRPAALARDRVTTAAELSRRMRHALFFDRPRRS